MASHRNVYKLNDVTEASQLSRELKPTFLSNYQYRDLGSQALQERKRTYTLITFLGLPLLEGGHGE